MAYTSKKAGLLGAQMEYGQATLSSGSVAVETTLTKILAVSLTFAEAPGADNQLYCAGTISAGAVTITATGSLNKAVNYVFIGY